MTSFSIFKSFIDFLQSFIETVKFSPAIVYEYLCNIDTSKVKSPDLLPGFLFKNCATFIASPGLFNLSMHTSSLPKDWVTAKSSTSI